MKVLEIYVLLRVDRINVCTDNAVPKRYPTLLLVILGTQ